MEGRREGWRGGGREGERMIKLNVCNVPKIIMMM